MQIRAALFISLLILGAVRWWLTAVLALTVLWSVAAGLCHRLPDPPHACAQRERHGGAGGPPQTHVLQQRGRDHRHPRLRGCGWDVRGNPTPTAPLKKKKSRQACFSTSCACLSLQDFRTSRPPRPLRRRPNTPSVRGAHTLLLCWGCCGTSPSCSWCSATVGPFRRSAAPAAERLMTWLLLSTGFDLNNCWISFTRWMRWKSPDLSLRLQSVCWLEIKCARSKQIRQLQATVF